MAHTHKPDLVFQRNGRVHLNRRGCQFSQLLAVEECGSVDSDCIDRVPTYSTRLLATHSIRIFPLHFPSRASPCAIRFQMCYTHNETCCCCIKGEVIVFCCMALSRNSPQRTEESSGTSASMVRSWVNTKELLCSG